MEIRRSTVLKTRPCKLCIAFHEDSVFADFEHDENGQLYLVRISFDGYGCHNVNCELEAARINKDVSFYLLNELSEKYSESISVTSSILGYFSKIKGLLWRDALEEYGLI